MMAGGHNDALRRDARSEKSQKRRVCMSFCSGFVAQCGRQGFVLDPTRRGEDYVPPCSKQSRRDIYALIQIGHAGHPSMMKLKEDYVVMPPSISTYIDPL